jgi:hypothetical protein
VCPFGHRVGAWVIHFPAVVCTNSPKRDAANNHKGDFLWQVTDSAKQKVFLVDLNKQAVLEEHRTNPVETLPNGTIVAPITHRRS